MNEHPLAAILAAAADGRFPPFDGRVEVVPSPGGLCDALVAFTGHYVLAADVDPEEVADRWPADELSLPFSPASLVWLAQRLGRRPLTHDAVFASIGTGIGAPAGLRRDDGFAHPRVEEAKHFRSVESIWTDDEGSLLIFGRGLCGRWEVGYEIAPEQRGNGLGRRLAGAARGLVPAGAPLWAQVAPGNVASIRSTLAAGFVPVAAEVLFTSSG